MENFNFVISIMYLFPILCMILISVSGYLIYRKKKQMIYFIKKDTNNIECVKIGYNYFLLWWGGILFGLFCYLRGLSQHGINFTILTILYLSVNFIVTYAFEGVTSYFAEIIRLIIIYIYFYNSFKAGKIGNKLYAKNLLSKGYEFHDTNPEVINYLKKHWNL